MKNWKRSAIIFSLAIGLLITGVATNTVNVTHAAEKKLEVNNVVHQQTIKEIKKRAVAGKTTNSQNFSLGSKTKDIVKKWGKPDKVSDAQYLRYSKKNIEFYAQSGRVNLIISTDKKYDGITYKEVKKELGKPSKEARGDDGVYLTYKAGKHTFVIAFYYNNAGNAPDTIKDVSVY